MLAAGVPTASTHDIAHINAPDKMATDVPDTTMDTNYATREDGFAPAAAFDLIDLEPKKTVAVHSAVVTLNAALVTNSSDSAARTTICQEANSIDGMVRFPKAKRSRGARLYRPSQCTIRLRTTTASATQAPPPSAPPARASSPDFLKIKEPYAGNMQR